MSVSTTGFVLTEKKDVFEVLSTIRDALTEDYSVFPRIECEPKGRYFNFSFKLNNESRMLMVHFDCDCDYSEYLGSKIIWSLNYWGLAEEIILSICKAMKRFGQVYYEANGYDGKIVEVK